MPTKLISKTLLGALSAAVLAAPAFAGGNCNSGQCDMAVKVMPGFTPEFGPMTIRTEQPMGHLRSINFQRAPNVSITRIHGMMPSAGLSDAPSGFTGGCHPTSTTYCRQDAGRPVQVQMNQPRVPLALYSPPAPAPVVAAPSTPRVVRIGGGYDPSKFTPRVYGDPTFVPGIAHVPTSIVDRDPARAQQVLDTGRAVAQPVVVAGTGTVPQFAQRPMMNQQMMQRPMMAQPMMQRPMMQQGMMPQPMFQAPRFAQPQYQPSAPILQQSGPMTGAYGSSVAGDGTYWEKVSGPTVMGSTLATSVICKRQLPTRVVRPIVGVPVPVAVPGCGPVQAHAPQGHRSHAQAAGRYSQPAPGRWIQ